MSELTDGLDRIYKRLSNHAPYRVSQLTPGLSLEEINEIAQGLPFNLPSEVYELYQWRDGHGFNDIHIYLETKYMAREHIVRVANTVGYGFKASMYKRFIETTSNLFDRY